MTTLMLAGLVPSGSIEPDGTPEHVRIPVGGHIGLALPLPDGLDWTEEACTAVLAQAQHALLCRYAVMADVLPVALGGLFSGTGSLRRHLVQDAENIETLSRTLAGRIEYSLAVNILPDADAPVAAVTGRDHLRQSARLRDNRTSRSAARRRFVDSLSESLRTSTEALRFTGGKSPKKLARIDFLILRNLFSTCRDLLEARVPDATALDLDLTLTGPYPAFSFLGSKTDG